MKNKSHILIINGPNLNFLGIREPSIYGYFTMKKLIHLTSKISKKLNIKITNFQTNAEHEIINKIYQNFKIIDFIIINPAALTHTSISIRDALLSVQIPFYEVHISNIYNREKFRKKNYFSDIAKGTICGFGIYGYIFAIKNAVKFISEKKKIK